MHAKRQNKQGEYKRTVGIRPTIILESYCFLLCKERGQNNSSSRALPEGTCFAIPGRKTMSRQRRNLSSSYNVLIEVNQQQSLVHAGVLCESTHSEDLQLGAHKLRAAGNVGNRHRKRTHVLKQKEIRVRAIY